ETVAQNLGIGDDDADAAGEFACGGVPIGHIGGERTAPQGDLRLFVEGREVELLLGTIAIVGKEAGRAFQRLDAAIGRGSRIVMLDLREHAERLGGEEMSEIEAREIEPGMVRAAGAASAAARSSLTRRSMKVSVSGPFHAAKSNKRWRSVGTPPSSRFCSLESARPCGRVICTVSVSGRTTRSFVFGRTTTPCTLSSKRKSTKLRAVSMPRPSSPTGTMISLSPSTGSLIMSGAAA